MLVMDKKRMIVTITLPTVSTVNLTYITFIEKAEVFPDHLEQM